MAVLKYGGTFLAVLQYGGTFSAVLQYGGTFSAVPGTSGFCGTFSAVMQYGGTFLAVPGNAKIWRYRFWRFPVMPKYGGNYRQCRDRPPRWENYGGNFPEEYPGFLLFERSEFLIHTKLFRNIGLHTKKTTCVRVPLNLVSE